MCRAMGKRNTYWDVARGMAMMIVIFAHCLGFFDGESFTHPVHWIISTFQMVLFFVISGCVCALGRERGSIETIQHKARSLLVPYAIWYLLEVLAVGLLSRQMPSLYGFWYGLFNGGPWFLRVLFFVFVGHACNRWLITHLRFYASCPLVAVVIAGAWILAKIPGIACFRQFGYFLLWFEVAFCIMRLFIAYARASMLLSRPAFFFVGSFVLFLAFIPLLLSSGTSMNRLAIPPMAFLGTLAVLFCARMFVSYSTWAEGILRFTGWHSLAFYTVHGFFIACLRPFVSIAESSVFRLTPSIADFLNPFSGQLLIVTTAFLVLYAVTTSTIVLGNAVMRLVFRTDSDRS